MVNETKKIQIFLQICVNLEIFCEILLEFGIDFEFALIFLSYWATAKYPKIQAKL